MTTLPPDVAPRSSLPTSPPAWLPPGWIWTTYLHDGEAWDVANPSGLPAGTRILATGPRNDVPDRGGVYHLAMEGSRGVSQTRVWVSHRDPAVLAIRLVEAARVSRQVLDVVELELAQRLGVPS